MLLLGNGETGLVLCLFRRRDMPTRCVPQGNVSNVENDMLDCGLKFAHLINYRRRCEEEFGEEFW